MRIAGGVIGIFKTKARMNEKFSGIQELAMQSQSCSHDRFLGLVSWALTLSSPFLRTCWDTDHEGALSPTCLGFSLSHYHSPKTLDTGAPDPML